MAQQALGPGTVLPRRRALFGLLDADGWAWASVKAFAWLVIIILMLGYLPDRAYYLTVGRTVDLGVLVWSPINLCPPTNESLPCPAPVGALIPWEKSPVELDLPQPRTDGSVLQVGTQILYIGGSDGTTAQSNVYVAKTVGTGNFDKWAEGPPLPEPRADASVAYVAGSIYVFGGRDASGAPTTTVFVLSPDPQTGALGEWSTADDLALPEARSETASAITPDGLLLIGGRNADGPVATTLKTRLNDQGELGAWSAGGAPPGAAGRRDRRADRRLPVAVRRERRQRPGGQGPARRIRPRGRRGPAREPRHGQADPLGRQRPGEPAGAPHQRIRLGRQRRDLPRRRQRRLRPQDRALLGGADHRRRPAGVEAPAGQRPARAA